MSEDYIHSQTELESCNKWEDKAADNNKNWTSRFHFCLGADLSKHRQIWISHLATPNLYVESNAAVPQTADFLPIRLRYRAYVPITR